MLSWLYLLQGGGMLAAGAIAIAYWYRKKHIGLEYFFYGAVLWAIAVAIKAAMDFTITQPLNSAVVSTLPIVTALIFMSLYLGLRTGIFESGITYLAVKYTGLAQSTFDEALALGIGFGGAEAILLGAYALYSVASIISSYEILVGPVPLISLDPQSLPAILTPIAERLFLIACHAFATVLVVYAVRLKDLRWLYFSILFKTLIDGSILPFKYYPGTNGSWMIEPFYAALAIIGLAGLWWIKKNYGGYAPQGPDAGNAGIP